ncbi:MAG: TonB family protein [Bacteroidetes bacterium]|nr:TonB family protein [Bacteroidota bacterium]
MMSVRKTEEANLREEYPVWIQLGLVVALSILLIGFSWDLQNQQQFQVDLEEQDVVEMEEVQQTKQEVKPPPPPKPPVPMEVPNDEIIEDQNVDFDTSLDLDESLDTSQGPPPPDEGEEEEEQEVFVVVEDSPQLIGGLAALQGEVQYPEFAKKAGIEGRVFVQFVVDEDGNVQNPKVTRGVHKLLNEEAIRAVKQMKFKPGKQRGKPVKVQMSLPVTFRLK